jgi:arginyl-tRNA--protein-N-Asp/Glu arginylyltransferase
MITLTIWWGFFIYNKKCISRFITMHINNASTNINFTSFVEFTGVSTIEVWHKPTKTMVTATSTPSKLYSFYTMNLPSLTAINLVANNTDEILIRVFNANNLVWEYLGYWIVGTTNINNTWKQWDATAPVSPQWITL